MHAPHANRFFQSPTLTTMQGPSVENMRRTSVTYVRENSPMHSDELLEGSKTVHSNSNNDPQRTPVAAIVNFEGDVTSVRAHTLVTRWVTKPCLHFCIHSIALAACMILGMVMMLCTPYSSPEFSWWAGLFNLGLGGFLPQPEMKMNG